MVIKKMSNANKAWKRDDDKPAKKKRRIMVGNTEDVGGRTMIISSSALVAKKPSSSSSSSSSPPPPPPPPPPCASSAVADNNSSHLDLDMKKGSYVIVRSNDNLLYKAKVVQKIIHDTFDNTRIRVQYVGRKTTTLISRDMIYSVCDNTSRRRQLRSGQHDPIAMAIKREEYNATKLQSLSSKNNSTSSIPPIGPYPLKPVYQVGTHVYAAYWPPNDTHREGEPSWYPGIISSSHYNDSNNNIEKKSIGNSSSDDEHSVRLYNIDFDDGDSITNVPEQYVFLTEEYLVCAQEGRRTNNGGLLPWLGDVINIVDDKSSDDWARYVGWYMATIDGVQRSFTLLIDALRAYDSSVIRSKGWEKINMSDLNLPEEWTKLLSKKQGKEEEDNKEVQKKTRKAVGTQTRELTTTKKTGKAVGTQTRELTTTKKGRSSTQNCLPVDWYNTLPGTQTRELTTTKKGRSSTQNCLPVDWYNTLPARPRGESIEYYHSSSTVNNNQLKSAKNHSIVNAANESDNDDDDDDFSVDMVDGIKIRSKSNSHEERNNMVDGIKIQSKSNSHEERNKSIADYRDLSITESIDSDDVTTASDLLPVEKCFKCNVGNCQKWTYVKGGFCELHVGSAKTSNTKTLCGKDKFDGAGAKPSSGREWNSDSGMEFDCYDVRMHDAEMTTTHEESQPNSLLPTTRCIHSSREEPQSTPTLVGPFAEIMNEEQSTVATATKSSPTVKKGKSKSMPPQNNPIHVLLMNSKLAKSSCHTAEKMSDVGIEESDDDKVIDLTYCEDESTTDSANSKSCPPPPAIPHQNSEDYMMVWTCDVCGVAQLPTFEDAVEHEKVCTGLPSSSSPLPQLVNICEEQSTAVVPIAGFSNDKQSAALALPITGIESAHQIQVLPKKKRSVKTSIMDHIYNDYSHVEMEIDVDVSKKTSLNFPAKLHAILSDTNNQHIICWQPHGRSWKIVNSFLLLSIILPKFSVNSHSFMSLVSQWGFKPLLSPGPDYKSYYHEWFLRGRPDLTKHIQRLINPGRRLPNLADEPDLYAISLNHPIPASVDAVPENKEKSLLKDRGKALEIGTGDNRNNCSLEHNNLQNLAIAVAPPPLEGDTACPIPNSAMPPVQGAPPIAAPVVPAIIAAENAVDQLCDNNPKLLLQRKQSKQIFHVWLEDKKKNWRSKQEHQVEVELSLIDTATQKKTEDYMKVWTCDVCHVVQFPTFEEAVEHEKICTGIPRSSWSQTKSALFEHEKSEKEPSNSVITSEPSNQALGGVNLYVTYPLPQPQHLSSTALNAAVVAAANDFVGDTGVCDAIEQEPIMEVPVAAMTSKPRQVTVPDTVGVRERYTDVMTGVIGVPLGVEAATTSGCPEHKEPHTSFFSQLKETVQHSSLHNTTTMNGSDDDNEDMVKMALELEDVEGAVECNLENIHQASEESSHCCKSDDKSSATAEATAKTKYTTLGIDDVLVTIVEHESV